MTRFRHTGIVIKPDPTSKVGVMVNLVLQQNGLQCNAEQGSVVLLYGGYNTMGQEFGGDQFEVIQSAFHMLMEVSGPVYHLYIAFQTQCTWRASSSHCNK